MVFGMPFQNKHIIVYTLGYQIPELRKIVYDE